MNFDINKIKRKMLIKYPFFGTIIANSDFNINNEIPTTETNGKTIYYNEEFMNNLSVEEQVLILSHEVCHIGFNHILRSKNKNMEVWGKAVDGVVNAYLQRDGLKLLDGMVDIPEAIDYDAEELYNKLMKERKEENQNNNKESNSSQNDSNSKSNNSQKDSDKNPFNNNHSKWQQAVKDHDKQEIENEQNKSNAEGKKTQNEINQKQKELEKMGEKEAFNKNKEEKKKELEKLKNELAKSSMNPGTKTNENIREVKDIGRGKPILDWRYVLKEAVKFDVDWSYKNATIEDGVVKANLEEILISETEILLDTSGSIDKVLLRNFLKECKNIMEYSKVKVGCFDTKFYGFHEIRNEEDIDNMEFQGGGGTNFEVAVSSFTNRVENKIIFTDGEAHMPETIVDAIWIVFGNTIISPKGGRVIYIKDKDLKYLYSSSDTSCKLIKKMY